MSEAAKKKPVAEVKREQRLSGLQAEYEHAKRAGAGPDALARISEQIVEYGGEAPKAAKKASSKQAATRSKRGS